MEFKNKAVRMLVLLLIITGCTVTLKDDENPDESAESGNSAPIDGTAYSRKGTVFDWRDTGFSYFLDGEGNVILSYGSGETVKAPLVLSPDMNYEGPNTRNTGFFISGEKTAIAYGDPDTPNFAKVMISDDKGRSWDNASVGLDDGFDNAATWIKIGFTTEDEGWMVICSFIGLGREDHYIYKSADGGKIWTPVEGNINKVYSRVLSGAAFVNSKTGFLCFRYEFADFCPAVCVTRDGGLTWSKADIKLPEEYEREWYSQTPLSPVTDGESIILPVVLNDGNGEEKTVYLKSGDTGNTWVFDKEAPNNGRARNVLQ